MNTSIQLLSTMSPPIKPKWKNPKKKGPTLLALKKNIRYSQNSIRIKRDSIIVIESSDSYESECSPIIISDSSSDSSSYSDKENPYLSKKAYKNVKNWIGNIETTQFSDVSTIFGDNSNKYSSDNVALNSTCLTEKNIRFDELFKNKITAKTTDTIIINDSMLESTQISSSNKNVILKETLTNKISTFNSDNEIINKLNGDSLEKNESISEEKNSLLSSDKSTSLDKYFVDSSINCSSHSLNLNKMSLNEENLTNKVNDCAINQQSDIIDDSFNKSQNNSNNLFEKDNLLLSSDVSSRKASDIIDDSFEKSTDEIKNNQSPVQLEKNTPKPISNFDDILNSLYGVKWQENRHKIIPQTEKHFHKNKTTKKIINSERKPKNIYNNPYLDREIEKSKDLLENLKTERSKKFQSPFIESLRKICDPDSSNDDNSFKDARTKLNFSDDDDDDYQDSNNKRLEVLPLTYDNDGDDSSDECDKPVNKANDKKSLQSPKIRRNLYNINSKTDINIKQPKKKTVFNYNTDLISDDDNDESDGDLPQVLNINTNLDVNRNTRKIIQRSRTKINDNSVTKQTTKTNNVFGFLESLSEGIPLAKCNPTAKIYRIQFKTCKHELTKTLFNLYNEKVFNGKLSSDTPIEWNNKMRLTAGMCHCKKITRSSGLTDYIIKKISLSEKVVDSADRLRTTLIHEMCHGATWVIDHCHDGHGPLWQAWTQKALKIFPELPPIKRCHNYNIKTKYTYKCVKCGYCIGRHTKSLNINKKRCGYCFGKFEILLNKTTKKGETKTIPTTPKREATGFALFVKDNYSSYKSPLLKHGDVMKILSQKFSALKINKNTDEII